MSQLHILIVLFIVTLFTSCSPKKSQDTDADPIDIEDILTEEGWTDLMDLSLWHAYNKDEVHDGWVLSEGVLHFDPSKGSRGDLVTNDSYEDFELSLEWQIDSCGNSGIMWGVAESPDLSAPYLTGPEMQILDDACHADGNIDKHRAGDLYDMIACNQPAVNPVGEWNEVIIRSENGFVTFHLNGIKVVEFQMYDEEWDRMVANSKFKDWKEFGKHKNGKIALQDHSDPVWFRNIKIKTL